MAKSDSRPGIEQLEFQRKWLEKKLECGRLTGDEETFTIDVLEDLDLQIAATPCSTVQDLRAKLERLADLLWPSDLPIPEDCLEHVMLAAALRDARNLSSHV